MLSLHDFQGIRRVVVLALLAAGLLTACGDNAASPGAPSHALSGSLVPTPTTAPPQADFGALPGRATVTPSDDAPSAVPDVGPPQPNAVPAAPITPWVTSPFSFPTHLPESLSTPTRDCTTVFPLDNVESISFGRTTIAQLEASFGHAEAVNGRPPRFRFEADGCTLLVTLGTDEALEAELLGYGTLELLLDRYGPPAATGVAMGNLTLTLFGNAVLLYPEEGIIAIFELSPDDLTPGTPVMSLQFRPPYQVEKQITRLHLEPVDWQPPVAPPGR